MKRSVKYLAWMLLMVCCAGCQFLLFDPLPGGKPRIVSIHIPGIPPENISIDQERYLIHVKVPERMPPGSSVPDIKVSGKVYAGTSHLSGAIFVQDSLVYRQIPLYEIGTFTNKTNSQKIAAIYRVDLIPQGPLEIDPEKLAQMSSHEVGSWLLHIPFKNLYANALPVQTRFINRETKEVSVYDSTSPNLLYYGNPYVRMMSRSWGTSAEQLNMLNVDVIDFAAKVIPGTYDVEFVTKDGDVLKVPQPITFQLNLVRINGWESDEVPRLRPGETYVLTGRNLFANDISVTVLDSNDRVVEVPEVEFDPYGTRMGLKLPTSIKQGHYAVRIISKATQIQYCRQIHVTPLPLAPLEISRISPPSIACSIQGPLVLDRTVYTQLLVQGTAARAQLKLVAVQDSARVHSVFIGSPTPSEDKTKFRLRTLIQIPSGMYHVSVQVINEFGSIVQEGPPYWRVVEVR
ncbi:hypothetical protein [Salmonirosea aquatica]|uniref:Uncharacterized protein n=1 Tax=Salmonirosea aquatica TaxID=2654236 RepID=A0A7C9BNI6_9BACT|nr:hypothetical protein [Cytophagaceae bacterium SJW1-29]